MSHIHWVAPQNKLEIPRDKDEVNKREIHEYDGRSHDPDTMVTPLTPKLTRKAKALAKAPPTIASRREEEFLKLIFCTFLFFFFPFFLDSSHQKVRVTMMLAEQRTLQIITV